MIQAVSTCVALVVIYICCTAIAQWLHDRVMYWWTVERRQRF
jgi:hypothetical protein